MTRIPIFLNFKAFVSLQLLLQQPTPGTTWTSPEHLSQSPKTYWDSS